MYFTARDVASGDYLFPSFVAYCLFAVGFPNLQNVSTFLLVASDVVRKGLCVLWLLFRTMKDVSQDNINTSANTDAFMFSW
jgi:hypothetical protein